MNELLLERMRYILTTKISTWEEKRMMGGICFMVNHKMCFGTFRDGMMCRIDPNEMDELLNVNGAEQSKMGKRIMKGYIFVNPIGLEDDQEIEYWISKCLEFNPKAKSSKKKRN